MNTPTALSTFRETPLLQSLPPHLAERMVAGREGMPTDGRYVLYWMHHACRVTDNPALDAALTIAHQADLPAVVFQEIDEQSPYASDRHHAFWIQCALEVDRKLRKMNLASAVHVQRSGHEGSFVASLAADAAVVVTDEMPTGPWPMRVSGLADAVAAPVISVDASCLVPMTLSTKAYERAFAFRRATADLREQRLREPWRPVAAPKRRIDVDWPFEPIDAGRTSVNELIAAARIDHAVAPVPDTPGGEDAAQRRWARFKASGLRRYADRRNDPLVDGVSRLSPYLHRGCISAMQIAREATAIGGRGAEKFLDELLVWRELAYHFCKHRPDHQTLKAIPAWARETLADHVTDDRPAIHAWTTLSRGETGDALWDAAQKSLLIRGELHNNVRMTWGKAVLKWTRSPEETLAMLIDLNHRYALDGQDPASYGGLLWCLGQFDRPFTPSRAILGRVRSRSTATHARRLDVAAYSKRTLRPIGDATGRIAVIGAGIAGLMCARTLADHGLNVTVLDKGRGPSGRMSHRRGESGLAFNHGAQYFTAKSPAFQRHVDSWLSLGVISQWDGRLADVAGDGAVTPRDDGKVRYVGRPGMNAVGKHLASSLPVELGSRVSAMRREAGQWLLTLEKPGAEMAFDQVVLAVPAPQAEALLADVHRLGAVSGQAKMTPTLTAMVAFDTPLNTGFDAAFLEDDHLRWAMRREARPNGDSPDCWTLHASHDWSLEQLESDPQQSAQQMVQRFLDRIRQKALTPRHVSGHRWRYAHVDQAIGQEHLWDADAGLALCGDWLIGPRVEAAWTSGVSAAGAMLRQIAFDHQRRLAPAAAAAAATAPAMEASL